MFSVCLAIMISKNILLKARKYFVQFFLFFALGRFVSIESENRCNRAFSNDYGCCGLQKQRRSCKGSCRNKILLNKNDLKYIERTFFVCARTFCLSSILKTRQQVKLKL